MAKPKIDASDPEALFKEIFDDDLWIKEEFRKLIPTELKELAGG